MGMGLLDDRGVCYAYVIFVVSVIFVDRKIDKNNASSNNKTLNNM
jgi:hypothetical protein